MVVQVDDQIFEHASELDMLATLHDLFAQFVRQEHHWHVTVHDDPEKYLIQPLQGYREFVQEYFKKTFEGPPPKRANRMVRVVRPQDVDSHAVASADSGSVIRTHVAGMRVSVTRRDRRLDIISTDLVQRYLKERLMVVVENINSDRCFVETAFRHYQGVDIASLPIKFEHGGGSSIRDVVRELEGRNRAVCFVDSDTLPDGTMASDKRKAQDELIRLCEALGYDLLILSKRETENYIPDEALKRWLASKGFEGEHPYFDLEEHRKDFVDMKASIRQRVEASVSRHDTTTMTSTAKSRDSSRPCYGFSKYVWEAFRHVRSREELEGRDHQLDIRKLVSMIIEAV